MIGGAIRTYLRRHRVHQVHNAERDEQNSEKPMPAQNLFYQPQLQTATSTNENSRAYRGRRNRNKHALSHQVNRTKEENDLTETRRSNNERERRFLRAAKLDREFSQYDPANRQRRGSRQRGPEENVDRYAERSSTLFAPSVIL